MTTDNTFRSIDIVSRYCGSHIEPEEEELNEEDLAFIDALAATPDEETKAWLEAQGVDHEKSLGRVMALVLQPEAKAGPGHAKAQQDTLKEELAPGEDNVIRLCRLTEAARRIERAGPSDKSAFPSFAACAESCKGSNDNNAQTTWRQISAALWLLVAFVLGMFSFSGDTEIRAPLDSNKTAETPDLRRMEERFAALQAEMSRLEANAKTLEAQRIVSFEAINVLAERQRAFEQTIKTLDERKQATEQLLATLEERRQAAERTSQILATNRWRAVKIVQAQPGIKTQVEKQRPEKGAAEDEPQTPNQPAAYGAYAPMTTGSISLGPTPSLGTWSSLGTPAFETSPIPWKRPGYPERNQTASTNTENKHGGWRTVLDF
jgi:DNA repair exonuclease SbcCD ATPase subunit